jgi:ferredoxin
VRYTVELVVPDDCEVERVADGAAVDVERAVGEAASGPNGDAVSLAGETVELEVDEDEYVLCTATPASDYRIRVCQYEAMLEERASHDLPPGRSKR